jgi:nucleotide-binding universal stress UspA family protein
MPKIKHIIFPVDFSDRSNSAVPFVAEMARRHDAKVTLIAVAHPYYESALAGAPMIDPQLILDRVKADLDNAFVSDFAGLKVERVAMLGDPGPVIVDFVKQSKADLVMMPTRGYGLFRQLLLGSVTAKVLHDANVPVWTTSHAAELSPSPEHLAPHTILCAVDASLASIDLIRWSAELCKNLGASLRLVHAIPATDVSPERPMDQGFQEALIENARNRIQGLEKTADIEAPICVGTGQVPDVVREEALQHKADLVLIGRGALQETMGRLRTHSYGIIRNAPCPVLSV